MFQSLSHEIEYHLYFFLYYSVISLSAKASNMTGNEESPKPASFFLHECVYRGDVRQLSLLIRQGHDLGLQVRKNYRSLRNVLYFYVLFEIGCTRQHCTTFGCYVGSKRMCTSPVCTWCSCQNKKYRRLEPLGRSHKVSVFGLQKAFEFQYLNNVENF